MKKLVYGLFVVSAAVLLFTTAGCSKRERALAGVSAVSAIGAGASFLKGHSERNENRKRKIHELRYGPIRYKKIG